MTLTKRQKILIPILVLVLAFLLWQLYALLVPASSVPAPATLAQKPKIKKIQPLTQVDLQAHNAAQIPAAPKLTTNQTVQATAKQEQQAPQPGEQAAKPTQVAHPSVAQATTSDASSKSAQLAKLASHVENKINATKNNANSDTAAKQIAAAQQAAKQHLAPQPAHMAPVSEVANTVGLSATQQQYLQLVNRYQILRLQKMIAQSNQQIAQAELGAAEAEAKLGKFRGSRDVVNVATPNVKRVRPSRAYQLVYTGQSNGRWNATLKRNGQLIDVHVGSTVAGGRVMAINSQRVILQQGRRRAVINFGGERVFTVPKNVRVIKKFTSLESNQADHPNVQPQPQASHQQIKAHLAAVKPANTASDVAAPKIVKLPSKPANFKDGAKQLMQQIAARIKKQDENISPIKAENKVNPQPSKTPVKTSHKVSKAKTKKAVVTKKATQNKQFVLNQNDSKQYLQQAFNQSEKHLLTLKPNTYTIQLIADKNLKAVIQFMQRFKLQGKAHYFRVHHNGKLWYALIYGQYKTSADAINAINHMSASMQKWGPYVRRVGMIQAQLKKENKALA